VPHPTSEASDETEAWSLSPPASSLPPRRPFRTRALLFCLIGISAGLFAGAAVPGETIIHGRLTAGTHSLSDVLVSDGYRVTRTDGDGSYRLPVDGQSGRFVFVTTPRGFWTEKFYQSIDAATAIGRADFEFKPVHQEDRFDFVFITDMHLEKPEIGVPKFKASLAEINRLQPEPVLIWAQGDICLQGGSGSAYVDGLATVTMPVRNGAGNHEMMLKEDNPRGAFEQLFGPLTIPSTGAGSTASCWMATSRFRGRRVGKPCMEPWRAGNWPGSQPIWRHNRVANPSSSVCTFRSSPHTPNADSTVPTTRRTGRSPMPTN